MVVWANSKELNAMAADSATTNPPIKKKINPKKLTNGLQESISVMLFSIPMRYLDEPAVLTVLVAIVAI